MVVRTKSEKNVWYWLHGLWQVFQKKCHQWSIERGSIRQSEIVVTPGYVEPAYRVPEPSLKRALKMLRRFALTDPCISVEMLQTRKWKIYELCKTSIFGFFFRITIFLFFLHFFPSTWFCIFLRIWLVDISINIMLFIIQSIFSVL